MVVKVEARDDEIESRRAEMKKGVRVCLGGGVYGRVKRRGETLEGGRGKEQNEKENRVKEEG